MRISCESLPLMGEFNLLQQIQKAEHLKFEFYGFTFEILNSEEMSEMVYMESSV